MKVDLLLSCFLLCFSINVNAQWQSLSWKPDVQLTCEGGDSTRTVKGLDGFSAFSILDSSTCLNVTLLGDNQTIRLSALPNTLGDYIVINLEGYATDIGSEPIHAPWGRDEFGLLSVRLVTSATDVFLNPADGQGTLSSGVGIESSGQQFIRSQYFSKIGVANHQPCLQSLVEGAEALYTTRIFLYINDGATIPNEIDVRLEYSFEQIDGKVYTEYYAPASSFNGQAYEYEFEEYFTRLQPDYARYRFDVGLEENTAEPQDIIFKKEGGVVSLLVQEPDIQRSTVSQEPHRLHFDLTDVEFCLQGEMVFPKGSSVVSSGTKYSFKDSFSCLGILPESSFTFASGPHDDFATDGVGMLLLHGTSKLHFEEEAELSFGGVFALRNTEESIPEITLERDVKLVINEFASVYAGRRPIDQYAIRVYVNDGATFDMSTASSEVQSLFDVRYGYPSHEVIEQGYYAVFPNPVDGKIAKVRRSDNSFPISQVEVVDAWGRKVSTQVVPSENQVVEVPLPGAGLFMLRVSNILGEVSTHQVFCY